MPIIVVMPSENPEETSFSRCALVKGYPIVIQNSDNPYREFGVQYDRELKEKGGKVIDQVTRENKFAVVMAGRPYHNDPLVNHELPEMLVNMGVPVLTADSIPELGKVELRRSRIDIVNNFHARMLSSSIVAANNPNLEYIQIVSFGCGHDAVLSDEIIVS